jgi:formate--tetrahydrofolate ligase
VQDVFGLPAVVAINHRTHDTEAELALLTWRCEALGTPVVVARHWAEGGKGAADLAREVVRLCDKPSSFSYVYDDEQPLWDKMRAIAQRIYGAADIDADSKIRQRIRDLEQAGYGRFPICVAKTQYSFSTDAALRGAPSGHIVTIREVRLAAGAEFIVLICGDIMTMPGLPKVPSSQAIDVNEAGQIVGLF